MSDQLAILHLTHEGHGAGSSISIALLARSQQAAGHRVAIGAPAGTWLETLARRAGVAFAAVGYSHIGMAATRIEDLAREMEADIVNAHSSRDRAACRRLRWADRMPCALVMTRRGMPMSTPLSAIASGFAADRTIAVSRPVRRALIRRGTPPWRIGVVHNAVDLGRIEQPVASVERERVRLLIDDQAGRRGETDRPVIGVVSRLKDHDVLLDAMRFVRTPATLCLVGFEPDPALRRLEIPLMHRIAWVPFQEDVRPFYDFLDIVALPTRHEGLSQSVLEAMALGKPVVTTAAGGNTDAITDGEHGLLVPPADPRALGAAIQRLIDDPDLRRRLGTAARLRARTEFTIDRTLSGTEEVYRTAIARRGSRPGDQ